MDIKKNDIMRNVGIGAIASVPYIGGILSYVMDKTLPEQVSLRYFSFIQSLENDIKLLKKEIDYGRFETPQFYSAFVKVIHEIICNHLEEKRILYKNILINTVDAYWNCNKNEFFFSITEHLSIDAINYLYLIYIGIINERNKDIPFTFSNLIKHLQSQKDYIITVMTELTRYNLITGVRLTEFGKQYCDFIFSPVTLNYVENQLGISFY